MRHALLFALITLGCSARVQKPALDAAFANDEMRAETFEATLRALDEHPQYVDELFQATLSHPVTLDRFLRATGRELERDEFARFTAERLVAEPKGLKRTLIAVLDEASDDPPALKAASEAMAERAQVSAIVVVQSDASIRGNLRALLQEALKNPEARKSFLKGVAENADAMARLIAPNPDVMAALLKAFGRVGVDKAKGEIEAAAKALE
ncbi:MAG: hypothetical protein EOO73_14000 [Myxococcales bacterium]|nr:MAG: hypothetical protein EOO73_14000 [Myxococcales bacterium]